MIGAPMHGGRVVEQGIKTSSEASREKADVLLALLPILLDRKALTGSARRDLSLSLKATADRAETWRVWTSAAQALPDEDTAALELALFKELGQRLSAHAAADAGTLPASKRPAPISRSAMEVRAEAYDWLEAPEAFLSHVPGEPGIRFLEMMAGEEPGPDKLNPNIGERRQISWIHLFRILIPLALLIGVVLYQEVWG